MVKLASAASVLVFSSCLSCLPLLSTPSAMASEDNPWSVGVGATTLGSSLSVGYDFSESMRGRGLVNYFNYDYESEDSGNDYNVNLNLQSLGALLDWHPASSGFRVTGGLFLNNNSASLAARADDLDLGGGSYDGNLDLDLDFNSIAPYLGIGWTSGRTNSGWSFVFDAGVMFQGSPQIAGSGSVSAMGQSCGFSVSDGGEATLEPVCNTIFATLEEDLESEHRELRDTLDNYNLYPVIGLGVAYQF